MKNKFLCLLMYLLKVNRKAIYLFFFFCNLAIVPVFGEETSIKTEEIEPEYVTCNDVSIIESFASDDYKSEKEKQGRSIANGKTTDDIESINSQYINYINFPYNEKNIDYLFQPLRISNSNDKIEGTFLTCGLASGDVICDSERLISKDGITCQKEFKQKNSEEIINIPIIDCEIYSAYIDRDTTIAGNNINNKNDSTKIIDKACYPENHICNKYKNDVLNKYYSAVKKSSDETKKEFYIFEKKVIREKINQGGVELRQNCDLELLSCDYKIMNESKNSKPTGFTDDEYINVVFNNASNLNNKKFVNNIFGNLGDNAFFINPDKTKSNRFSVNDIKTTNCNKNKYDKAVGAYLNCKKECFDKIKEGTSEYPICVEGCENDYDNNYRIPCKNDFIMRSPYYFKYIVYNDTNKDVYYFIKNINQTSLGKVCNGYLPNCKYVYPGDGLKVLYNNTITKEDGNNILSRFGFYSDNNGVKNSAEEGSNNKNDGIKEEYLWYVSEQNISDRRCLSIVSNDDKLPNYDIGYCSDLTDNGDGLKYPNGLESGYIEVADCDSESSDCIEKGEKKFKFKAPNCYLKSCADLTAEELEKIIGIDDKKAKYCSEYYWLENQYGMKYFPKEKPLYCSDLEGVYILDNNNKVSVISEIEYNKVGTKNEGIKKIISQLKFRDEDFEIRKHNYINKRKECELVEEKKDKVIIEGKDGKKTQINESMTYTDYNCSGVTPEERYYSYGGGMNKRKSNCYFKSCFSMTADERNRVVNANMLNISKELKDTEKRTTSERDKCKKYLESNGCEFGSDGKMTKECNCGDEDEKCSCKNEDYMIKQIDINLFKEENLPVYCDDTFMISSRIDNITEFNDLNLNVIPCYELKKIVNHDISGNNVLNSNDLIGNYNTNTSYVLCRNNYPSSFNNSMISNDILKEDEGSILNSVFSYSEENAKFSGSYSNSSSNHTFSNPEYYIKMKYNPSNYGPDVDSLEIGKYKGVCQNLDNNILYYNARIPGVDLNGGLDADYFDTDLVSNLMLLKNGSNNTDVTDNEEENDKEKFLEKYVYRCKNYKSKYNKLSTTIIDCGLYYDFDASKETAEDKDKSLGNDIISIMDADVKKFFKFACISEVEDKKPDDREVLIDAVDFRGALRSDQYNWLLKPIPLKDYNSADKNKYINYKSTRNIVPSTILKVSNGCAFFENYDDADVNKVVGAKMADAIPLNKTNYISTTNFSDPLRRRKEGEKCNEFEPYCENELIKQNIVPTALDQKMVKCQVGFDEKGEPKMKNCSVTVCARYPESVSNKDLNVCGVREGSIFRDKCLEVPINGNKDERTVYLSKISGNNDSLNSLLNFGKKSDRWRTKIVDDKILVFRDSIVDYNSSSNIAGTPHFEDKLEKKCGTPATKEEIDREPEKAYEGLCLEKDFYFPKGDTQKSSDYWTKANAIGLETELYNIRNKKFIYFDADQYYQRHIAAKGSTYGSLMAIYLVGCEIPAVGCAIAHAFNGNKPGYDQCYNTCVSEALYQTTDLTVKDYRGKFIYYMNSSRNHILDYFDIGKLPYGTTNSNYIPDSGLIIGGNIIDNNNYLYRYYPRYDTIERDIRSKMESNINVNGERFYHNTVLARDIIRACKLERFVGDRDVNKFDKNGRQHKTGEMNYYESANYEFIYYKLDKDGNQIGECWEDDIEKCLDPEILRCLKSYDVSFIKHNIANDGVDDEFIMKKGRHLKKYDDCHSMLIGACSDKNGEYGQYVPTNIVAYTGNKYSNEELKVNNDCKLDEYGKPLGDLSRCRGFKDNTNGNELFYTETQSVPVPLYTHPFLFYTLITPKNTPELFDPTFILSQYYKFSDYYENGNILGTPKDIGRADDIIVDFFYPAFKFNYDFINGTNDSDYNNKYQNRNNFISRIEAKNKRSYPYIVEYSSNNIPNAAPFKYIMDKTYDIDKKGCYTPKVCIYEIAVVSREKNEELGVCASDIPGYGDNDNGDIKDGEKDAKEQIVKLAVDSQNRLTECFKIVDNGIGCYERNIPYLDKFILKLDKDSFTYNTPFINVYLIPNDPSKIDFNYITNDAKDIYIMRENNPSSIIEIDSSFENKPIEDRVAKRAYSEKQGFGLNFERSYCSQMYFDYYTSLDKIQREETKRDKKDRALINSLKTKTSTINTVIKPECDKENGEEGEYIIDEGVSLRDIALSSEEKMEGKRQCEEAKNECIIQCGGNNNENCVKRCTEDYEKCDIKYTSNEVISRKTTIVKKYNESYGGFNEICVADNDIKNILKVYKSQNPGTTKSTLPRVIAFVDKEGRGVKTKCLLNSESRKKAKCLKAETVYVYCEQNEIGLGECKDPKFDIKSLKWGYIKKIDCKSLLSETNINSDNIEKIKACYKGGFNYNGNIYTKDGEQEDICACEVLGSKQSIPEGGFFITREMTPREYGLCVNLVTPEICPAIRYYDSSAKYTDDNLILGLTKAEIEKREEAGLLKYTDYQQHHWRTNEKVSGFMQSTMFSLNLEHAEFDSSIFCDVTDDQMRKFLEEKKLTDSTIDVDKILEEKGEEYNNKKNEYAEKTDYYNKYCVGGTRIINGECNGYWKWSEDNLATAPQAICTVQQDEKGNKMYEYRLVGAGCERYTCKGIAYDEKTGYIGDENELNQLKASNVFKSSEIYAFNSFQDESNLDFRSYLIKEEQDPITVDRRGMSNGFASWKKVISGDYASLEVAYDCFTGYSPAGLNYDVKNEINNENMIIRINSGADKLDINYDSPDNLLESSVIRNNFISHIFGQNNKFDILKDRFKLEEDLTEKAERYPIRKCNQKGEWMTVNDVYNLSLIDQSILGNNFYYNNYNYKNEGDSNDLNYWLKMYDFGKTLDNKERNRNTSFGGYCERNVCLAINPENKNIYEKEGVYDKFAGCVKYYGEKDKFERCIKNYVYDRKEKIESGSRYRVWEHTGGASWENVGAPRNESGKINETGTSGDVSKNVTRIFREKRNNEGSSSVKTKYLKKVQGICRTDYGYYNRGSIFKSTNFDNQFGDLKNEFAGEITSSNEFAVDQRRSDFGADENNGTKPERVCTSYGVWSPVFNRCFRGCEMLDIYHTNFTDEFSNKIELTKPKEVGERWKNYVKNEYFYIENNDIKSTIISNFDYSIDGVMDKKFKSFGLNISPDYTQPTNNNTGLPNKGLSIGDYITGGAKWPRTIVNETSSIDYEDKLNDKYGLRYVEVEGSCDSSFSIVDGNDERVRTFVARGRDGNGNPIRPKRRCYEDGSWGQVYEETRCVLQKTCKDFNFTLYDLMLLMQIYNNNEYDIYKNDNYDNYRDENYRNELINKLNTTLSRTITYGYYPPNTDVMEEKSCEGCGSTTIKNCCIYNFAAGNNAVGNEALSYIANIARNEGGFISTGADNGNSVTGKLICNMTGDIGEKLTGWSLGRTDIGDYFVPNTCDEGLLGKSGNSDYVDNIDLLVHHVDKNNNFVPVIYNVNNDTRKSTKSIRESNILHYAEETKLHYLYNNITTNYMASEYPKATSIENESTKNVKIGSKFYESYQMHYRCNEDYFYNELNRDKNGNAINGDNQKKGKDIAYYHNDIILECKKDGNNGYKFRPNSNSDSSKDEPVIRQPLYPNKCFVRSCGGDSNEYHKHWTLSYPKEFFEAFSVNATLSNTNYVKDTDNKEYTDNILKNNTEELFKHIKFTGGSDSKLNSISYMECPRIDAEGKKDKNGTIQTAFILNDERSKINKIENYIEYYGKDKDDAAGYKDRGFVTRISATCRNRFESENDNSRKTINGISANTLNTNERSYDIQKYGELDNNNLPHSFCRDLNKKENIKITIKDKDNKEKVIDISDCKTFSESQIAGGRVPKLNPDGSTPDPVKEYVFLNDLKKDGGYCVPMACSGKDLKFENGKVLECTEAEKKANKCFSLAKSYYGFGDKIVIRNFADNPNDFDSNINHKNEKITEIFTISGDNKYNLGRICGNNSDVYSKGSGDPYSYDVFLSLLNETNKENAETCFGLLNSKSEIVKIMKPSSEDCTTDNKPQGYCTYKEKGYEQVAEVKETFNKKYIIMVHYGSVYEENLGIKRMYEAREGYTTYSEPDNIKELIADYIVNTLIFNGSDSIEYNSSYARSTALQNKIYDLMIVPARIEAETALKSGTCYEYYSSNSVANTENISTVKITNTTVANDYKSKIGNNSITFYSKTDNANFVGVDVGIACSKTITEKDNEGKDISKSVDGTKVCDVSVYNEKYDEVFKSKKTVLKDEIKGSTSDSAWKDEYNRQYGIYKMIDFLNEKTERKIKEKIIDDNNNEKTIERDEYNLDLYNDFVATVDGENNELTEQELNNDNRKPVNATLIKKSIKESETSYFIYYIDENPEREENSNEISGTIYYMNVIDGKIKCGSLSNVKENNISGSLDDTKEVCSVSDNTIKNTLNNSYKQFKDFFDTNSTIYKNLRDKNEAINNEEKICVGSNGSYASYFTKMKSYNPNSNNSTNPFASGLYLAMKCTPDGWSVYGEASCKQRCSGFSSKETHVDPYTTLNDGRKYKIYVSNLRYTKTAEAYFMGIINACVANNPGSIAWGKIKITCGDDGRLINDKEEESHGRKGRGFERHYNWGKARHEFKLKPYFEFSDDGNETRECIKEWKSVPRTGRKYFHCLNRGNLYENSDLSPGSSTRNGATILKGCQYKNGSCVK